MYEEPVKEPSIEAIEAGFLANIDELTYAADAMFTGFQGYTEKEDPQGRWHIYFTAYDLLNENGNLLTSHRKFYGEFMSDEDWRILEESCQAVPGFAGLNLQIMIPHKIEIGFRAQGELYVKYLKFDPCLSQEEVQRWVKHSNDTELHVVENSKGIEGTDWYRIVLNRKPAL